MAVSSPPQISLQESSCTYWITEASKRLLYSLHSLSTIHLYAIKYSPKWTCPDHSKCYLCPGNKRAQGDSNPKYTKTFVFVNDYSAVKEEQAEYKQEENPRGGAASQFGYPAADLLQTSPVSSCVQNQLRENAMS
jgi:hypothetical protein